MSSEKPIKFALYLVLDKPEEEKSDSFFIIYYKSNKVDYLQGECGGRHKYIPAKATLHELLAKSVLCPPM